MYKLLTKMAVIVLDSYNGVSICVAIIKIEPTPVMVNMSPEIVATSGLELVYTNSPVLLENGAIRANGLSP
jgi:hypothetical protein